MANIDLDQARKRLEAERDRIRERIASEEAILPAYDGSPTESRYGNHPADRATDTHEEQKALALRAHYEGELNSVEEALRRVDDGTYGTCAECGVQIPLERLEVMPAAKHCVNCQSKVEARR